MIADYYYMGVGIGTSSGAERLPSFDKALLDAGVGNYNLVRLSSIMPAYCMERKKVELKEGSLLPTAYATITSSQEDQSIASVIGYGIPEDPDHVSVIMEYSDKDITLQEAFNTLKSMIQEAYDARGWKLKDINWTGIQHTVNKGETATTFACISEWW